MPHYFLDLATIEREILGDISLYIRAPQLDEYLACVHPHNREFIRAFLRANHTRTRDESVLDIIRESLRLIHADPNKRDAQISWVIEDSLPPVCVDRIQTQRVFIDLIWNAIEVTDGSANTVKVLIRAFVKQEHEVIVQIIDSGTGL